jgi:hypothetical protein
MRLLRLGVFSTYPKCNRQPRLSLASVQLLECALQFFKLLSRLAEFAFCGEALVVGQVFGSFRDERVEVGCGLRERNKERFQGELYAVYVCEPGRSKRDRVTIRKYFDGQKGRRVDRSARKRRSDISDCRVRS